jgi:hypothetical protein
MKRTVQALVCCSLLLAAAEVLSQEINVVVLDGKSGHALRNAVVWVQYRETAADHEAPANRVLQRIQYKTGPDGVVRVPLAMTPPVQLTVSASAEPYCLGFLVAATADIVERGAVNRCGHKPGDPAPTPNPGEIRFLIRRIPWWARLLAPLERE